MLGMGPLCSEGWGKLGEFSSGCVVEGGASQHGCSFGGEGWPGAPEEGKEARTLGYNGIFF